LGILFGGGAYPGRIDFHHLITHFPAQKIVFHFFTYYLLASCINIFYKLFTLTNAFLIVSGIKSD